MRVDSFHVVMKATFSWVLTYVMKLDECGTGDRT